MIHQTKLTDILKLNIFKNCELKSSAGSIKSFLWHSVLKILIGHCNGYWWTCKHKHSWSVMVSSNGIILLSCKLLPCLFFEWAKTLHRENETDILNQVKFGIWWNTWIPTLSFAPVTAVEPVIHSMYHQYSRYSLWKQQDVTFNVQESMPPHPIDTSDASKTILYGDRFNCISAVSWLLPLFLLFRCTNMLVSLPSRLHTFAE